MKKLLLIAIVGFIFFGCKKDEIKVVIPEVSIFSVGDITETTAICVGVTGGVKISVSGFCWSTSELPAIENNKTTNDSIIGSFTNTITGLQPETKYFIRAYATNSAGTAYSSQISFTTMKPVVVTDIDGNTYKTVKIGTQLWMAENLKVTRFNNGEAIDYITYSASWANFARLGLSAYCFYNNDPSNKPIYGALYNWHAVNTGILAPKGWHVPTDDEWEMLTTFLGGGYVAGGKLKETGTAHWKTPNDGATNETGFSALPGGTRSEDGTFNHIGYSGYWLSASVESSILAVIFSMDTKNSSAYKNYSLTSEGHSVRCVKD